MFGTESSPPRALRFWMSLRIRFRQVHQPDPLEGLTLNTSASGVLFHYAGESSLQVNGRIEMQLLMPASQDGTVKSRVNCSGRVVRMLRQSDGTGTYVAATIDSYRLERMAPS